MAEIVGDAFELHLTNSSDALTQILGLLTVTPPDPEIELVEITDQDSGKIREYMASMTEPGEIGGTLKYDPGSATDLLFIEHRDSKETRAAKIVVPKAATGSRDITFNAIVTKYTRPDGSVGELQECSFTIKVTPASEGDTA